VSFHFNFYCENGAHFSFDYSLTAMEAEKPEGMGVFVRKITSSFQTRPLKTQQGKAYSAQM